MKDLIVLTAIAYFVHQQIGDHFQLLKYNSDDEVVAQIDTFASLDECRQEQQRQKEHAQLLEFLSSSYSCEEIEWFSKK
ncbi:hypothetical protein FE810_03535 [Thalassotalea litorea]|uniref:Uncharacterized protein n=1 Tax=Thalassotalea litorea TaxID=2020715 RepID=A0A5R9IP91_9GAMM|nr:hypothetical protein [Thalassotalea litorea]TLU67365.1 hypothetical protein FE810_03535 [Thalassotalea litorea]